MIDENTTVEQEKLHGIFIGTVLQHLAHGKLKVFIHGIHPDEFKNKPDLLPTCLQMVPQFGGSHDGNGLFSYPNIGATVLCTFANGDQNIPIMLGAIQGGENAFGQYELVKKPDEISSERHLVTSGKSHIEMYENGKISAIVFDPIRTEAKVKYDDSIDGQISVDAVESRPICEKVDSKELSNINCQFVLDNNAANGTISSSTAWYNPISESKIISADNGQTIIVSSLNGEEQNSFYDVAGNDGMHNDGQMHELTNIFTMNVTSQEGMKQFIHPLTSQISVVNHYGIDGNQYSDIVSNIVDSSNYMEKNNRNENIISTSNIMAEHSSTINQNIPLDFQLYGKTSYKQIENYTKAGEGTVPEEKIKQLKYTASNDFHATNDLEMRFETLSSSRLQESDTTIALVSHTNKHNASSNLIINAEHGLQTNSSYHDNDTTIIEKNVVQIETDNAANIEANTNKKAFIKLYSKDKVTKTLNGIPEKHDVECVNYMLPTDDKIEISIIDNIGKNSCRIILTANGYAKIMASQQIDIEAPNVNIIGEKMVQQFKNMTLNAQTMNIKGSTGDCKIKNVSLLNHKHFETQSGDVVKPQPSKTAAASN